MAMAIPGGDFLTTGLNLIAQSLLIPVVIILLIFVVVVVVSLGGLIYEYTSRTKVSTQRTSLLSLLTTAELSVPESLRIFLIQRSQSLTREDRSRTWLKHRTSSVMWKARSASSLMISAIQQDHSLPAARS